MSIRPLTRDDFDGFFAEINGGHRPFSWQCRLVDHVLEHGRWPDRITAPTGAGKSSVVDIHLFLNALDAAGTGPRVPRRMFTVVNRRGLVDNQHDHANQILKRMAEDRESEEDGSLVSLAGHWLRTLRVTEDSAPFRTSVLRGQLSPRDLPVDDPTSCAVVAATPDMWGSRLLFRGYGSTRQARPREAAMAGVDSVLVLDEAHLNRQLLVTARRVSDIQRQYPDLGVPLLQVVETTATAASGVGAFADIGVDPEQLDDPRDEALAARVNAPKTVTLVPVDGWNGKPANRRVVAEAVEQTLRLHREGQDSTIDDQLVGTIGCIVNHVDTALNVARDLKKEGLKVRVLVGRMRPWDLQKLKDEHPGLFTPAGDESVDVVVATQTIEVGMDIDFAGLVTELAPGPALAQRFGRVNRLGLRDRSDLVVLTPVSRDLVKEEHPPYRGQDLRDGWDWIDEVAAVGEANPRVIHSLPPAATTPDRLLFQRVENADLIGFARTSRRYFAEDDLELWLRDDLEADPPTGGIVVRDNLPDNDAAALELLNILPPQDSEVFPAQLSVLRGILDTLVVPEDRREWMEEQAREKRKLTTRFRVFRSTADGMVLVEDGYRVAPGDVFVIDRGERFTTEDVVHGNPQDDHAPQPVPLEITHPGVTVRVHHQDLSADEKEFFRDLTERDADEATELWRDLHEGNDAVTVEKSALLVEQHPSRTLVPAWYLLRDASRTTVSETDRQEWTPSVGKVLLDDHSRDVAERSRRIVDLLGVAEAHAEVVVEAALAHDRGKSDERFQRMLGRCGDALLAKSRARSRQQARAAKSASGLLAGWRHEQLSALLVAADQENGVSERNDLTLRVVGTSHGQGRPDFPHVAEELLTPGDLNLSLARRLFTDGEWDSLIDRTDKAHGVYACAFLEYLERAADGQISQEGR